MIHEKLNTLNIDNMIPNNTNDLKKKYFGGTLYL